MSILVWLTSEQSADWIRKAKTTSPSGIQPVSHDSQPLYAHDKEIALIFDAMLYYSVFSMFDPISS